MIFLKESKKVKQIFISEPASNFFSFLFFNKIKIWVVRFIDVEQLSQ